MQHPRRLKVGLLWHSVNSANLGVGALTVSQIEIARAARAGVEVCFLVLGGKDQRPAYVSGPDVVAAGFRQRDRRRPVGGLGSLVRRTDLVLDIGAGDSFADIYGTRRAAVRLIAKLGVDGAALASFRYRGRGWPGRATAETRDGRIASMSYAESWGGILNRHVQFRCKICPDGIGIFVDLACADAWETDAAGHPLFEEAPGESLVLARTEQGERLLANAIAARALSWVAD